MAPRLVSDGDLLERLGLLFRANGYDGSSLGDIAAATGLQKSSLYHRFPGGKQQMASEIAGTIGIHFAEEVLAPLNGAGTARERLTEVAVRLAAFYDDGRRSCLLDTLSIGDPGGEATAGWASPPRAGSLHSLESRAQKERDRPRPGAEPRTRWPRSRGHWSSHGSPAIGAPFARSLERLPSLLLGPSLPSARSPRKRK